MDYFTLDMKSPHRPLSFINSHYLHTSQPNRLNCRPSHTPVHWHKTVIFTQTLDMPLALHMTMVQSVHGLANKTSVTSRSTNACPSLTKTGGQP
ncbi:hypothetical protein GDO78_018592 [Eleutherodactylus coqui]|uniref:Uncharacterized protein n=1 Tax=Eleutherodactylus coqui TaxID=57060 RepID=A0A8J6BCB1_ELECQ|nr:hypothetical protein GDO78_018592 [Eleutherodactylus coqui]